MTGRAKQDLDGTCALPTTWPQAHALIWPLIVPPQSSGRITHLSAALHLGDMQDYSACHERLSALMAKVANIKDQVAFTEMRQGRALEGSAPEEGPPQVQYLCGSALAGGCV